VPSSPSAILPVLILLGIGAGASYIGFWAMMPDTVEYGEWRSGVRAEGAIFGLVSLVQKAGLGLAAAALGELLGAIGYRANVAQRPETLASMKLVMVAAPAVLGLAVASIIAFYPLDGRTHARMVRVAAWRNSRRRAALAVKA
jgi:GPH family glycoside/pentoside/hexuronide:cation symporter